MRKGEIFFLFLFVFLISCELIRLTEQRKSGVKPDPSNSVGSVFLLIQEVKVQNYSGASKLFVFEDSTLTSEKIIELDDKLKRLERNIINRKVTFYKVDTLNQGEHLILMEFDHVYEYFFVTQKYNEYWLIRNFGEKK